MEGNEVYHAIYTRCMSLMLGAEHVRRGCDKEAEQSLSTSGCVREGPCTSNTRMRDYSSAAAVSAASAAAAAVVRRFLAAVSYAFAASALMS